MTQRESDRVERAYYPDGRLKTEVRWIGGGPIGLSRRWHPNGTLAYESTIKNGAEEGVVRFWNSRGELLGSYEIVNGTGTAFLWHENGRVHGEMPILAGSFHGRQRVWWEDGTLSSDVFWIRGARVSKRKYIEAMATDPSVPRYEDLSISPDQKAPRAAKHQGKGERSRKKEPPRTKRQASLCSEDVELRDWIKATSRGGVRTLGELSSEQTLELAEELYRLCPEEVRVIKITRYPHGDENSGHLVVRLPKQTNARTALLEWCAEWARELGYDPEDDTGQDEILVALD